MLPWVAAGLASAGLTAVVGHHVWAHPTGTQASPSLTVSTDLTGALEAGRVPGCTALALVVLACWGVLLVTRGRVRRVVAVLGLLAALGAAVAVVLGFGSAPGEVSRAYQTFGLTLHVTRTLWAYLAFPLVALTVLTAAAAVRLAGSWPEMGRRYDAPEATTAPAAVPLGDQQDDVGLWKAISEGRDPTSGPSA